MAGEIELVRNYSDCSTDNGFQYEFYCNRCGNGYRTRFDTWELSAATQALDGASSMFGGLFGRAGDAGERVKSAAWEKAHDKAFEKVVGEIRPRFVQCPRCSAWVCREQCWNEKRGLCRECAPDLGVEMSAAQASRSVEEVWAHAKMSEEDKKLAAGNWRETIVASCPSCGAPQETNAKLCPTCGAALKTAPHCTQCGAKLQPGAKFCGECGSPAG